MAGPLGSALGSLGSAPCEAADLKTARTSAALGIKRQCCSARDLGLVNSIRPELCCFSIEIPLWAYGGTTGSHTNLIDEADLIRVHHTILKTTVRSLSPLSIDELKDDIGACCNTDPSVDASRL